MSLQVVAIAAIILIVLLVVLAAFKGGLDKVLPDLNSVNECPISDCVASGECSGGEEVRGLGCPEKAEGKPYCCVKQNA